MKKIISSVLALAMLFCLTACGGDEGNSTTSLKLEGTYTKDLMGTSINVFNWGEYISDGSEGSLDINAEFKELTGITVNYTNYDSNEVLYSKLNGGGASYDVIIPSDYMIERLVGDGMLQKINTANISNYKYIPEEYKSQYFDLKNEYSIPYTVGLVGLIYNKTMVDETPTSWNIMWDEKYKDMVLNFDNSRDAFGIAQYLLGQDVNTTNPADWNAAAEKLKEQKQNGVLQSYVMDKIFNIMENDEAALAPYYAGDFLSMKANNDNLEFVYPSEGTNIFIDSFCIPASAKNVTAAEMYINFMLEPEVALANAEYICYACPHTAVVNNDNYSLKGNEILYPTTPVKSQYFHNLDTETLDLLSSLWTDVKQFTAG